MDYLLGDYTEKKCRDVPFPVFARRKAELLKIGEVFTSVRPGVDRQF